MTSLRRNGSADSVSGRRDETRRDSKHDCKLGASLENADEDVSMQETDLN